MSLVCKEGAGQPRDIYIPYIYSVGLGVVSFGSSIHLNYGTVGGRPCRGLKSGVVTVSYRYRTNYSTVKTELNRKQLWLLASFDMH
jgi:hypothetical protein